ncbi:zinc finger MYM-type protein 1-like [Schistocerca serialis cubense]|uniref:zinc finger MYM-type protein 1-like n=1 Tax=Schistocerca serialis cubense TaxID=2023355 RepID=UPI00214E706E|nr:zinc finger MYM-type protein 1-like [Schistocerca serialis cubense]
MNRKLTNYFGKPERRAINSRKESEACAIELEPSQACASRDYNFDNTKQLFTDQFHKQIRVILCKLYLDSPELVKVRKQNQTIKNEWMSEYNWLSYSKMLRGGFCTACVLFSPSGAEIGSQALKTLVKEPLVKYKKDMEDLRHHENAKYHKFSMEKAIEFTKSMESSKKSIAVVLDIKKSSLKDEKTDYLLEVKHAVFQSFLAFRMDAGDEDLKHHFSTCGRNSSMISNTVQNEVIHCIRDTICSSMSRDVKKGKFFSIICDETTDVTTKEQMTFCVRYIDIETFVTIEAMNEELKTLGLSYQYLCGQGYDGGSKMAGRFKGVQALILSKQPKCSLEEVISRLPLTNPKKTKLKAMCPTRWVERHDTLITFQELFVPVVTLLDELSSSRETNAEMASKACMFISAVRRGDFIVVLATAAYYFSLTLRLSEQLQRPKMDLTTALNHVNDVLEVFNYIRTDSKIVFGSIFEDSVKLAEEIGSVIAMPRTISTQTKRDNVSASNAEEYFRRTVFLPVVNRFIAELETRFSHPITTSRSELKLWKKKWVDESKRPEIVSEALNNCDEQFFPNVYVLFQISGTTPATTSTPERSFSTLRRIKTYLQRDMDIENLIDIFSKKKQRRMSMTNWAEDGNIQ